MFKARWVVVIALCLAGAFVTSTAQARTLSSSAVPTGLRAQVLSLGAKCLPLEITQNVGCGGDAHIFQLLDRIKNKPPHYQQMVNIYKQASALCGQIKWVSNDPALKNATVFNNRAYSELACYWGQVNSSKPAVALTMIIPNAGHKRLAGTCDGLPSAAWGRIKCKSVKSGVSAEMPYTQSTSHTAQQVLDTTAGYLSLQRWEPSPSVYGSLAQRDRGAFDQIAASLSLTRG